MMPAFGFDILAVLKHRTPVLGTSMLSNHGLAEKPSIAFSRRAISRASSIRTPLLPYAVTRICPVAPSNTHRPKS